MLKISFIKLSGMVATISLVRIIDEIIIDNGVNKVSEWFTPCDNGKIYVKIIKLDTKKRTYVRNVILGNMRDFIFSFFVTFIL